MLRYPVILTADDDGVAASFPDIPEALTCGDSREDALEMAADALVTAMEFYFEDRRPVPMPSAPKAGQELVDLPASLSAKVLLLNEMLAQKVSQSELARRLDTRPQDVQRIVNLDHATKIDTIEAAFRALGRRMELRIA
ncbi:type II toxin-antitoxin system HicB family antitoxin [Cupriavidus gilardii]|uniref:type II toxin-antitoxin system HicB family antitoxin n=1 Tax=Cupriavidus gilardii TaxID=82541 RepID=UPI001EE55CE7|nr:type II toxin-antitoxin system HicB family antitoxin [Cupriavidus gilardii]MCG5259846.1 type II toxin-antitoxin system HicB family antitoxin [Cupriavidus gilardii]MDF9429895.1 type II toxin-antitoxin system HicB family antitoxin [Cupriavidus gilardii]